MTPDPNFDTLAERLRERLTESRDDYGLGQCASCDVTLTQADVDEGCCTNCGDGIPGDGEDLNGWELNYDD
jgi:hypothetical protein